MAAFDPDWTVHPGATLLEWMVEDLAVRMQTSPPVIEGLLKGTESLTPELAGKLQTATGISFRFWSGLERQFREDLAANKRWEPGSLSAHL